MRFAGALFVMVWVLGYHERLCQCCLEAIGQLHPIFRERPSVIVISKRYRFWVLLAACTVSAALILALMPAEKTIGQVIKIVYLHGALSRAGMVGFWAAGAAGLAYLVRPRPGLAHWTRALAVSGWLFWIAHFVVSMPATRLTWGPWVAWGEPRVTMTLQIAVAGLAVITINELLDHPRFTAGANFLLGLAILFLAARTGVLRHPLDPIGSSPSAVLRLAYLALLVPVVGSMVLIAWQLIQRRTRPAPMSTPNQQQAQAG